MGDTEPLPAGDADSAVTILAAGVDTQGRQHERLIVEQGQAPRRALRQAGFRAGAPVSARWESPDAFVMEFAGFPATWRGTARSAATQPARQPSGLAITSVRQRLASYGVITARAGSYLAHDSVLLTSLSTRIHATGLWILPGGGIEREEDPQHALVREAWEESGQHVSVAGLMDVASGHRVGARSDGTVEDFHAIRLIYRAECEAPSEPVVHDVGGSTQSALWWPIAELRAGKWPGTLAPWATHALRSAGLVGS